MNNQLIDMIYYAIFIGTILASSSLTAQVSVDLQDNTNNIVYRGFDNILTIHNDSNLSEDDYTLICYNCTLHKEVRGVSLPKNTLNLRAGESRNSVLHVKMNNADTSEFIFRVSNLPVPELYINGIRNGESLATIQGGENWTLKVAYPEEITIEYDSDIISWECVLNDQMYTGMSSELTQELIHAIQNAKSGTLIHFVLIDKDNRSGIQRKKNASFRI